MAKAKEQFASLLDFSANPDEEIVITVKGIPSVVMLHADNYQWLIDQIDIWSNRELVDELIKAKNGYDPSELFTTEQVLAELKARSEREKTATN